MIDALSLPAHQPFVLTKNELLSRVEEAAVSRAEIARVLNLAPARITEMFKNERDLSFDEARTLARHFKIDEGPGAVDLKEIAAENNFVFVEQVDLALGLGASFLEHPPEVTGLVPFPGDWLEGLFQGSLEHLKVVRGKGDSMEPTIKDGDVVLIDLSQKRLTDQDLIWACAYGNLGMIKRLRQTPRGSYLIMSDNPAVKSDEAFDDELHIIGRVIWIGRRM